MGYQDEPSLPRQIVCRQVPARQVQVVGWLVDQQETVVSQEEQRQEEEVLQEQDQAGEDALEGEELFQQLEERPLTEEGLLPDIDAMLEESRPEEPQEELEEPQPEKKKRRFWPFGRKRDEE